jgi:hypothetical protein
MMLFCTDSFLQILVISFYLVPPKYRFKNHLFCTNITDVTSYFAKQTKHKLMVKFEVHMNSKFSKTMIHFNVQVTFHETMLEMYHFETT